MFANRVVLAVTAMSLATAVASADSSILQSVQQEARAHSLLLAEGAAPTVGHGAIAPGLPPYGFSIVQGDYSLNISPAVQFRAVANCGEDRKHGDTSVETGFEVTRARLGVMGFAGSPKLHYFARWEAGDITGTVELLDLIISYQCDDQITFRAGQIKAAFAHETAVDAFDVLGATRSFTNGLIGIPDGLNGRTQGAGFWYGNPTNPLHAIVLFHDGVGSVNSSFQDAGTAHWAMGAAVAYTVMGNWQDYWDFTARTNTKDLLVLSAGGDVTQLDNLNLYFFMIEAQYETASRLALYGAFNGQIFDFRNVPADDQFNWGFHVQAGYALDKVWEVFGRYSLVKFEEDTAVGEDTFHEITIGANYYLLDGGPGNNAKVTAELTWLPSGSPSALPYHQIIGGTDQSEFVLRLQLQVRP
jgi:hypothetical protein